MRTNDHQYSSATHWVLTTESKDAKVGFVSSGLNQGPISPGTIFLLLPPKQQ